MSKTNLIERAREAWHAREEERAAEVPTATEFQRRAADDLGVVLKCEVDPLLIVEKERESPYTPAETTIDGYLVQCSMLYGGRNHGWHRAGVWRVCLARSFRFRKRDVWVDFCDLADLADALGLPRQGASDAV